ncbi:hypothetical protein DL765_002527 [Monosporascus sp. GIB2]|nr:hypothetical protein DL765_002527 [Monosporascus sp. GIB2]
MYRCLLTSTLAHSQTPHASSSRLPNVLTDLVNPGHALTSEHLERGPRQLDLAGEEPVLQTAHVRAVGLDDAHGGPALGAHGAAHGLPGPRVVVLEGPVRGALDRDVLLRHHEGVARHAAAAPLAAVAVAAQRVEGRQRLVRRHRHLRVA